MNEICAGFLPAVKVEKMAGVKWRGRAARQVAVAFTSPGAVLARQMSRAGGIGINKIVTVNNIVTGGQAQGQPKWAV